MVDFILFCFFIGVFCAGFWCGATFSTAAAMWTHAKATVRDWFA